MSTDYKAISFILRGKRRKSIMLSLDKPKTPKQLASECKISISNVSNALAELIEAGFVKCKTPDAHMYKYFELTQKGKKALKQSLAEEINSQRIK